MKKVVQSEIVWVEWAKGLSPAESDFNKLVSQEFSLEGIKLQKMRDDLRKTELLMPKIRGAMVSKRKVHDQAKGLEFVTSHISELDCLIQVKKANNLVELFETID
ncbi:hypothetical protein TNIN_499791 [Trichonephila inaurata madagascariensis]|uniref:Uncharacterized protein n=1 Tax=Trichonephila inaurata madagascariensis TaxID=2747483 RepID=A0A8X6XRQ4_9ARAC|nr:hypothetical protein TNIN_499791 [Trichonephila inaurata madagascariensis]